MMTAQAQVHADAAACGTKTSDNASLLSDVTRNFSAKLAMEVMLHSALDAASLVCIGQGLSCRAQHISLSGTAATLLYFSV